jgi:hypothetical protein
VLAGPTLGIWGHTRPPILLGHVDVILVVVICGRDTISTMGGFSESDLVVLTNTLNQDMSDYVGPDVELVVSQVNNVVAPATQLTCQQLPTHDALTRSGDSGGHIHRGISRILRALAYLDFLAFCKPFPTGLYEGDLGYGSRGFCYLFRFI